MSKFLRRFSPRGRAFIVGAHLPTGGAFMAYSVGRVLHERFGYECLAVQIESEEQESSPFQYPVIFRSVPIDDIERAVRPEDVFIANPSFSDRLFGLSIKASRKLMYVQDFKTFAVLDGFFSHYVACSHPVRSFIEDVYRFRPPVINPFISTSPMQQAWSARPERTLFLYGKHYFEELQTVFMEQLVERQLRFDVSVFQPNQRHHDLLHAIEKHRYFVTLAPAEGFGLVPLEAMALGCVVVGFDAYGGLEYFRTRENCLVVPYPNVDQLVDGLAEISNDHDLSASISQRGTRDSANFTYARFEMEWTTYFERDMGLTRSES